MYLLFITPCKERTICDKKILSIILVTAIFFTTTGCDSTAGNSSKSKQEDTYHQLDYLLNQSSSTRLSSWYGNPIEFLAWIVSDVFESEITTTTDEGSETSMQNFQYARIARNENYLILNVDNLTEYPASGDFVVISGNIAGSIGYDDDFFSSDLEIEVTSFEPLTEKNINIQSSDTFTVDTKLSKGDITFTKATKNAGVDNESIILYFDFTNTGDNATQSPIKRFYVSQGDSFLMRDTTIVKDGLISDVTSIIEVETPIGETHSYYYPFSPAEGEFLSDADITISFLDDDFDLVYEYTLPLSETE